MNRQRVLLAALVGLLLLSLAYAFWAMPRQEKAPPRDLSKPATKSSTVVKKETKGAKSSRNARDTKGKPSAERLHLDLLATTSESFPGAGRDIFRFHGGWSPAVEVPVAVAPPVQEVAPPPPPPPPTAEQLLREKVNRFTFLGYLEKGGVRTVFLSGDGEISLVKAGDHFGKGNELVAREVSDRELVVGAAGVAEVVRVQLVENEKLMPTVLGTGQAAPSRSDAGTSASRSGRPNVVPRRILPQRVPPRPESPPADQEAGEVEPEEQPPDDGVKQEELLKQEPPGGEGDGDKE
jgi:hypothetical protein